MGGEPLREKVTVLISLQVWTHHRLQGISPYSPKIFWCGSSFPPVEILFCTDLYLAKNQEE